jgi:hypothetical protein
MADIGIVGSQMGNAFQSILEYGDINPGDDPSYEICKLIYLYHPFGAKIAEKPVRIAQSQKRIIKVPDGPEDECVKSFEQQQKKLKIKDVIFATRVQARVYGISSLAMLVDGEEFEEPVNWNKLTDRKITFNIYDPLNTAGSLVLNQNPLSSDFQHAQAIRVNARTFHPSRTRVIMNEFPIYISYTSSAFGFVGRSCYQRSLYPLKSYIQSMRTNDMIEVKVGVIVAKIKQAGAFITEGMMTALGLKREVVKEARLGNVINIGTEDEAIESLNLQNMEGPHAAARKYIIEDIASGTPMPAKLLTEESFAEGFGEGTEDAKEIARFIMEEREQLDPLYEFTDAVCMRKAWDKAFMDRMREKDKTLAGMSDEALFYKWSNSFSAEWPSLLVEPESEQIKVADVKLRALVAVLQVLMPLLKGEQLALVIEWVADNMNEMRLLFGNPLYLDYATIAEQADEADEERKALAAEGEPNAPKPFSKADSAQQAIEDLKSAIAVLSERQPRKKLELVK